MHLLHILSPGCGLSYLSDRSLSVQVGSHESSSLRITSGVTQGSHLGPVLFFVFINDLPRSTNAQTDLYAGDALLHAVTSRMNMKTIQQ